MSGLFLPAVQAELLSNAVVITGPPRSGTTLLGKLVGSLQRVEYRFEPPSLYMLAAAYAAGELPLELGAKLLSTYLCEDLLIEALHGRGLNFRPDDDSVVFGQLDWSAVVSRWQQVANRAQAIELGLSQGHVLCVKMPFLLDSLELVRAAIPKARVIVCVRDGIAVVNSMLSKQWLADAVLESELWPYAARHQGVNIPSCIPAAFHERWPAMTPATRACLMWAVHARHGLQQRGRADVIELRYEDLVAQPMPVVQQLADRLEQPFTPLTQRWIAAVRQPPPAADQPGICPFADQVDADVLAEFQALNASWGYGNPLSPS